MNTSQIEPSTTEPGLTTIDQADKQAAAAIESMPTISAKDALGLDESPRETLEREEAKVKSQVPQEKMQRDENGRFVNPKKPAKKDKAAVEKPAVEKPADPAPAAAVTPPPAPEPPKPEPPKTVKIGDREFKIEELEKILAEKEKPQTASVPAPAPAPEPPKQPTPEEIAKYEADYINAMAASIADANVTEEGLEKILVGGKEGVAALQNVLKGIAARSVLEARKSIYSELNPVIQQMDQRISPLLQNNEQLERHATAAMFTSKYPEYTGEYLQTATEVAEQLLAQYPREVSRMSREQFIEEVNKQSDRILSAEFKRWNPNAQGTWRDWAKGQKATQVAPAAATPSPAAAPAPAPAAPTAPSPSPAASPKPAVKPPAANSPGAVTGAPKDWQKGVASSLLS